MNIFEDGKVYIGNKNGLGINIDENLINQHLVSIFTFNA